MGTDTEAAALENPSAELVLTVVDPEDPPVNSENTATETEDALANTEVAPIETEAAVESEESDGDWVPFNKNDEDDSFEEVSVEYSSSDGVEEALTDDSEERFTEDSYSDDESVTQKSMYGIERKEKSKNDNGGRDLWIRSLVGNKIQEELDRVDLKHLKCFALTPDGKGIVYVEKDGECFWTSKIDSYLADDLNSSTKKRYPISISLGSEGRYFVKFSNGDLVWYGGEKLVGILKEKEAVKMVAFGKMFDSFALVYEDGQTDCNDIPKSLQNILENCEEDTKTEFLSMGAKGEYFVRQKKKKKFDGEGSSVETMVRYGNIHSDEIFSALEECPRDILKLVFGAACSFVATN